MVAALVVGPVGVHAAVGDLGGELFFITGADALAQILSWKDADELFELAHFIGVTRTGGSPAGSRR